MNKVLLVGRIANDIRTYTTSTGVNYARTSIAVNRRSNSSEPIADFIPVVAWRATADYMAKYLSKGALVSVEGSFTTNSFTRPGTNEIVRSYEVTIDAINTLESRSQREHRESMQNNMVQNSYRNGSFSQTNSKPNNSYNQGAPKFNGSQKPLDTIGADFEPMQHVENPNHDFGDADIFINGINDDDLN
ncbi:single strand binding protein [Mycoplasmopsis californica HAZ160_1]|uniref:Single-stranded DNA-binding protein n=1 Tax=Mycoplasmopsis californica HAZ160_1 TaxID=1397850 RepID=A0AAT9F868_9BACT|nr:single-stranded DNA-binding protein [Mycoplasmopsis californica]BAP01009.1 single strand binding protein [Mycoplasmopsis californica HAZ160_1]BBG40874.1 single strand binding protein [Mycoplasmopsis californica]BBG41468.1 single strand binding protein [Mycoplasmopsis californica]BBG42061.1 single strand binding protein [Mycoplasmopsis californica]BBG42644.1 single strand binding protein [Mycoplasmopsis californica]